MAAGATDFSVSTGDSENQQWLWRQEEEDRKKKEFYDKVNVFPTLFSLQLQFKNKHRLEQVLKNQEQTVERDHPYHLQTVRCHNLIVFILYLLHRLADALEYCEKLQHEFGKSIIGLTNLAVLQYEMGFKTKSEKTLTCLQDFYKFPEYKYLVSVAESEKGYALICLGPRYLLQAMDIFQELIDSCPSTDVFLWQYDLALAIRRNFNIFVYSEHPKFTAADLAEKAVELLKMVIERCPNTVYKARGQIELASLISHLKFFINCCKADDRERLLNICKQDHLALAQQAVETLGQEEDLYVFRVYGRLLKYDGREDEAITYLERAISLRDDAIANQLLAKTYLSFSWRRKKFMKSEGNLQGAASMLSCQPGSMEYNRCPPAHTVSLDEGLGARAVGGFDIQHSFDKPREGMPVSPEEVRLAAEFDASWEPYCYADGSLKPFATGFVGSISTTPGAHTSRVSEENKEEYKRLSDAFEESNLLNDDGTWKPQETQSVGNIRKHAAVEKPQNKPHLQTSLSYPPYTETSGGAFGGRRCRVHRYSGGTKESVLRCLLRISSDFNLYDETDELVQKAEEHYKRAFVIDPYNKSLLYDMGRFYAGINKPEKALDFFKKLTSCPVDQSPLELCNAYEQCGLCCIHMSQQQERSEADRNCYHSMGEDMLMNCLRVCQRAVAHMPNIGQRTTTLWSSYSEMMKILAEQNARTESQQVQIKKAEVHQLVGQYLEAIKVYQDVLAVAQISTAERKQAIYGLIRNNFHAGNFKDARFVLDMFLWSDDQKVIMEDMAASHELRMLCIDVYMGAAVEALCLRLQSDAQLSFQSALLLGGVLQRERLNEGEAECVYGQSDNHTAGTFDVCVFTDEGHIADNDEADVANRVSRVASSLTRIMQDIFGMRVSLNEEGVMPGHLGFSGECRLASIVDIIILILPPGGVLSPRMEYLAEAAIQSRRRAIIPIIVSENFCTAPPPLNLKPPFYGALDLMDFDEANLGMMEAGREALKKFLKFIISPPTYGTA